MRLPKSSTAWKWRTAEGIPNAKLILYEGYGQGLVLDNMEQVQKDILEFLKKD